MFSLHPNAYAAAVSGRKETNSSVAADLREYCHSLIEEKPVVPKVTLTSHPYRLQYMRVITAERTRTDWSTGRSTC